MVSISARRERVSSFRPLENHRRHDERTLRREEARQPAPQRLEVDRGVCGQTRLRVHRNDQVFAMRLARRLDEAPVRNAPADAAPQTGSVQASTPAAAPVQERPLVGPVPLEGFDFNKLQNPSVQTVKYRFGRVASQHALDGVHDKAGAEALLRQMRPEMEAAGLRIKDIKGDSILVNTEIGDEWVDVVRGAGAPNPGWWWGSNGTALPGTRYEGPAATSPSTPAQPAPTSPTTPAQPAPTGALPREPGAPLSTVPMKPEYATAPIDKSSVSASVISAAKWVKSRSPEYFNQGDNRDVAFKMMSDVIGSLRAAGYDAHRVVNHPSYPVGAGMRYGSDAVVVNGRIYDVYGGWGDGPSNPQALDVGAYEAGRLRE